MLLPLYLITPAIGLGVGWFAREWLLHRAPNLRFRYLRRDYFTGLNYLLNEQPDKAVDVFIKLIKADEETIETHLALGALFRRRGEVDRSIRIHQSLVSRQDLAQTYKIQALSALAQDYAKAGVLDRAEKLFLELVDMKAELPLSLRQLLLIYQQEKNWTAAIMVAERLNSVEPSETSQETLAQFYCEMAAELIRDGSSTNAKRYLLHAERIDKTCPRPCIMLGNLFHDQRRYKQAIACYKRVSERDSDYIYAVIPSIVECFKKLSDESGLLSYLQTELKIRPQPQVVLTMAKYLLKNDDAQTAIVFVAEQLKMHPSLLILQNLIALYRDTTHGDVADQLALLGGIIDSLLNKRNSFRCNQCGFSGKTHYWLCPGCQTWNSTRPVQDL
jgi:lipopolysaccharide assembly protein B